MAPRQAEIKVSEIGWIDGLEYRPLNDGHVEALKASNEPEKWPAIIVTPVDGKYGLIAGQHRVWAAKGLKLATIRAEIRDYGDDDFAAMYTDMWEDNSKHGQPPTVKERKEYALNLYRLNPSLSLREIGRRSGLPHQTVQRAIDAAKSDSTGDAASDAYRAANLNYAKRLKTGLLQFFEHEKQPSDVLFFKVKLGKGTANQKDTDYRALLLASEFKGVENAPAMLKSLAKSLEQAAARIEQKPAPRAKAQ